MTVLPVTTIFSQAMPSLSRLSWELEVGAKCRLARTPVSLRLASSGHGEYRLPVRRPASTWATEICW
ncbi:hypothetical protein D3C78_1554980 [compost metagenome]